MKRIIIALIMLFMLFTCCQAYAQTEEVIMELFCNDTICEDGKFYGGNLTLSSKIKKQLSNGEAIAIIAQYDDEGNLLDVALSKNIIEQPDDEITVSLSSVEETGIVKCMVFDAQTLEPICPAQVYASYDDNVTIWADMLEQSKSTISSTKYSTIEYYAAPEASNTIRLYVAPGPKITVNGVEVSKSDIDLFDLYADYITKIQLIENNDDAYYDVIDITVYEHGIVSEVLTDRSKIIFQNGTAVTFDFDNLLQSVEFYDKDGNLSSFDKISNGDVLAMVVGELDSNMYPVKAKAFQEKITIYNLKSSYVSGKLVGYDPDGMLYINDIPYCYTTNFVSDSSYNDVFKYGDARLGIEGDFYLSVNNIIIGYKGNVSNSNYAFILQGAESSSTWDKCYQIKVLLADGSIKTYDIDDEVVVYEGIDEKELIYADGDQRAYFAVAEWTLGSDNAHKRVIDFKTNSEGVITDITYVYLNSNDTNNYSQVEGEYIQSTSKLDGNRLDSDTIVFNIGVYDADDATVTDISSLYNECNYSGYVLAKDDTYRIFLMISGEMCFSSEQPIKIVDKSIYYLHNDETAIKVFYYTNENSERKSIMFTADSVSFDSESRYWNLTKGAVFDYLATKDGVADTYSVIANADNYGDYKLNSYALEGYKDDVEFIYGPISDIQYISENVIITVDGIEYTIDNSTNEYYYNTSATKPSVKIGNFLDTKIDIGNYVFMKLYDGKVTDIISSDSIVEVQ